MIQIQHYYTLTPEWQYGLVKNMGSTLISEKIAVIPNKLGKGITYFSQIMPGISVMLLDAVFSKEIVMNRMQTDHDIYILHFDLSDQINPITVDPTLQKKEQHTNGASGFSVLHSHIKSYFKPAVGKKIYALRLLIDNKLLKKLILKKNGTINNIENKILFYNHSNSDSKILVHTLKEKSVFDDTFDTYIRGISLKLLSNFINTFSHPSKDKITKSEIDALKTTKEYLLKNIDGQFPSIPFLSQMAGMSPTKYKTLFKRYYDIPPNQFFIKEKIIFANKLLKSGNYSSVTEILHLLNYSKTSFFISKYYKHFKKYPSTDLVKKQQ